jgi:hypothetical protein
MVTGHEEPLLAAWTARKDPKSSYLSSSCGVYILSGTLNIILPYHHLELVNAWQRSGE